MPYIKNFTLGKRYADATLAKISFEAKAMDLLCKWSKKPKNNLVVIGNPGVGKTYLCAALINHFNQNPTLLPPGYLSKNMLSWQEPVHSTRIWKESDFLSALRKKIAAHDNDDFVEYMKEIADDSIVFYDDLGSCGFNEWRSEMFFNLLDFRYENELPLVVTSNLNRKEIQEKYHGRVLDRLFAKENTILDLEGESHRQ